MNHSKNFLSEGLEKQVSYPDKFGYVEKRFKQSRTLIPLEEQKQILATKKQFFGKYIPETHLIPNGDSSYFIKQKYIKGNLLKDLKLSEMKHESLVQLLDLLQSYIRYSQHTEAFLDVLGYQDNSHLNAWQKILHKAVLAYKNFLVSSNIIVDEQGNVFLVDVCETLHDTKEHIYHKHTKLSSLKLAKLHIRKFFIKQTLNKIRQTIAKREEKLFELLHQKK